MSKVKVFVTVDTEHSIGGAFVDPKLKPVGNEKTILGRIGENTYGIPLIMDIADSFRIQLTFFLESINKYYFGDHESGKVCRYIIDRGHDIQLHIHPNYLSFSNLDSSKKRYSDLIGDYSLPQQKELLEEGISLLIRNGAKRILAFRAGSFGANRETLLALKKTGFLMDSSYNQAYLGFPCLFDDMKLNDVSQVNGIVEFPITNFIESSKLRTRRFMPLDLNGVSFGEIKYVLNEAKRLSMCSVTIILHSFSFVKAYDVQYKKTRPRFHVIRRFQKLCRFLSENRNDFETMNFGSLDSQKLADLSARPVHIFPKMPAPLSLIRGLQQLRDNLF